MSSARASAETLPSKCASASDLFMPSHYGETHMGLHIGNFYRPATFDCMDKPGDRIRTMRKALGWNQSKLAEEIGVDQSTVSDIERGAGFSAELLMRLAEKIGGSAELIMHGSDRRVWPFPKVPLARFSALDTEDKGYVQRRLQQAIEECERDHAGPALAIVSQRAEIEHPPEVPLRTQKTPPGKRQA